VSDQQDELPGERVERVVRAALVDWGLDALVREVDEVSAEGELTAEPQARTSQEHVRALLEAAAAHFRDRASIAQHTQEVLAELEIERECSLTRRAGACGGLARGDWTTDREAARALEVIIRDYFR
jgi:hypothetical protein